MRNTLAELDGAELEGGRDLDHAYRCCDVNGRGASFSRASLVARTMDVVSGIVTDAGNTDLSRLVPRSCVVTGTERVSRATMRVLFRCRSKTLEFAARHVLGSDDFERAETSAVAQDDCDLIVTDHPLLDVGAWRRGSAIRVAHWLRQRAAIGPSWPDTLQGFSSGLRKELRRWLGKRAYRARIVAGMPAKVEFYERFLLPYVRRRFGVAAVLPNSRTFRKEAQAAVLLELRADDALLGASLIRSDGESLFIGRTAFSSSQRAPSEVLDFFCFVLAQRLGCCWLDLGLTRPHLDDGVFRYKAKWRPQLAPTGGIKSRIRIRPLRPSAATLGFLSRNGFIERQAGKHFVRLLHMGGELGEDRLSQLTALAERASLDEMIVGLVGESSCAATPDRVTTFALGSFCDPVKSLLRLR